MKYRVSSSVVNRLRRFYPQWKRDTESGWTCYPDNTPAKMPVWFATHAAANLYKAMMQLGDTKGNNNEGTLPGTTNET